MDDPTGFSLIDRFPAQKYVILLDQHCPRWTDTASDSQWRIGGIKLAGPHTGLSAVDLYAGAGGLSLGLEAAGINVKAAVETDRWAAETYAFNFPRTDHFAQRVDALPEEFFRQFSGVDIVAGGPPCQGFSISAAHRRAADDPRNEEIFRFVETAIRLRPRVILLENVPEVARYRIGTNYLIDLVNEKLIRAGFAVAHWIVDCADFGVPQHRRRLFLIASTCGLPDLLGARTHGDQERPSDRTPWLTVRDAISDLPVVAAGEVAEGEWLRYTISARSNYQKSLRSNEGGCRNHVPMRHSARLVERFAAIEGGENGAAVWHTHPAAARGDREKPGTRFSQNHRRLLWDAPSPTITAHMYSTCLHPSQHRNVTVREAARLQSFPDDFRFLGKRTTLSAKLLAKKGLVDDMGLNQLNQVGNAVPPLMGKILGQSIVASINGVRCAEYA